MFNFKNAFIALVIAIVVIVTIAAQGDVPSQHTWSGECSFRGEIMVCITATEQ
jgi:hypothetical protein